MKLVNKKLTLAWILLRYTYGLLFIVVGIDKFFNVMTDWHQFLGVSTLSYIPISSSILLKGFGVIQIVAGLLLFTRWVWWGIYLIFGLLLLIFINLFSAPLSAVVITHDIVMIIGIIVFAHLTLIVRAK